jgi:hypothetical protein
LGDVGGGPAHERGIRKALRAHERLADRIDFGLRHEVRTVRDELPFDFVNEWRVDDYRILG